MLRLGVLVLLVALCNAALRIPLVKRETLLSADAYRESIERRHGTVQLDDKGNLPLMHYKYVQYYGKIAIGTSTPEQLLNVAFDTAITSIWVPSTDCPHREIDIRNKFCKNHTLFDIKTSKSAQFPKDTVDCNYRNFAVTKCRNGTDIVCAGSLCAKHQSILAATAVPNDYNQLYFDGVVGMGFVANITDQKDLPWFYNMMQQNRLSYPVFTLYLNSKGPELIIGDVNYTLLTGDFIFAPVSTKTGDHHWQFHAEMLEARNGSGNVIASTCTNPNGCNIKLDSGMPYIAGPMDDIAGLQNFIGAKQDKGGDYVIDCDKKKTAPMAVLHVLGAEVIMTGEDYILEVEKGKCITAFKAAKMKDWMFGDVFFAAYYTMFDVNLNRVGFAKAR